MAEVTVNGCGMIVPTQKLAYATVPFQQAQTIYYFEAALDVGTLFPCLNIPKGSYGPKENFRP